MKTKTSIRTFALLIVNFLPLSLLGQGTAFTCQGSLNDGPGKATGLYDLQFSIYDAASAGSLVAGPLTNAATAVSNGLFTATLDFGLGVFTGPPRWLDISVRTNGAATFVELTSRQPLTPTPYAITASNLTGTLPAAQLSGTLSPAQLSGTYSNGVNLNNSGNHFTGDGSELTGVNATALGGITAGGFWQTTGNSNITAGLNYLGTADSNALDFRVQNFRALRIQPDGRPGDVPNLIGGDLYNDVQQPYSGGNAIAGGGFDGGGNLIQTNSSGNFIGAGSQNVIGPNVFDSFIGGGRINSNFTSDSVIVGGWQNLIQTNSPYSVIDGGLYNALGPNADYAAIVGGYLNSNLTSYSVIGGGVRNYISTNITDAYYQPIYSVIGGGENNIANAGWDVIAGGYYNTNNGLVGFIGAGDFNVVNADYAFVGGGAYNVAGGTGSFVGGGGYDGFSSGGNQAGGHGSAIVGGVSNVVDSGSSESFIGGGFDNFIQSSYDSTIAGGGANVIQYNSIYSVINGGWANLIQSNAAYSAIGGGDHNTNFASGTIIATGERNTAYPGAYYSVIGGGLANAIGTNAFESIVAGGVANSATNNAAYSVVSGGYYNLAGGNYTVVPGGYQNATLGDYSFAAGRQAKAANFGTFVWADAEGTDFASTAPNQFLIRATGGVGINKNNPASALDVQGTVTANAFSGSGAALTGLNASQLTTGTVPDAGLFGTYSSVVDFVNPADSFTGNGTGLSALNAGQLTSGTIPDARQSANVALLNRDPQVFSGTNMFSSSIIMTDPTKTIQFPATSGANAPMITMFASGTANADRMVIAHSATYNNWGLQYQDFSDRFNFLSSGSAVMTVDLGAGKVGIGNNAPTNLLMVANARCDGSTWINASDRNLKEHFIPIDSEQILDKVAALPLNEWNYKNDPTPHLGPVAQDFYAQFNLGADDKSIATIDESGVALAAIQGLNKKVEAQAAELAEKDKRIDALERAVADLRTLVTQSVSENRREEVKR